MIVEALHVALNERPLSEFPDLINLLKKFLEFLEWLKFSEGKSHKKACDILIDLLAKVIRRDIRNFFSRIHFFVNSNGWVSVTKERHWKRTFIQHSCTARTICCIHVDDYGGDTKSLKHVVVLLKQYNIPEIIVENLMVCCCTDDASVNMG